ncbi:MAG: hypothetical protein IJZ20_00410, partial [Clostridia bacterium]|nr:hypothetical protein [Clostridia bacterium]
MKKFALVAIMVLTVVLSLSVMAHGASFTLDKSEYTVGEAIKITYEGFDGEALYLYSESNLPGGSEASLKQTDALTGSGNAEIVLPLNMFEGSCGVYLVNTDGSIADSKRISVKYKDTERTMSVDKTSVNTDDTVKISYENAESKDWFALYKKGQRPGSGAYYYLGGYVYASGSSGTVDFKIATTDNSGVRLESGKYILALLKNNGYEPALSVELDVTSVYGENEKQFTLDKSSYFPGDTMIIDYK